MPSECPFLKTHTNIINPICRFVEVETQKSDKVKVFYCKCCGAINRVDLEKVLQEQSKGVGIILLGIFLIIVGILLITEPEQRPSPRIGDSYSEESMLTH